MTEEIIRSMGLFAPEIVVVGFLVLLFVFDGLSPKLRESFVPMVIALVGCVAAAWAAVRVGTVPTKYFSGLVANDGLSYFFRFFFLFCCGVRLYLAFGSKEVTRRSRMEIVILVLCTTFGMSLMAIATNLLLLYIGIETVSI